MPVEVRQHVRTWEKLENPNLLVSFLAHVDGTDENIDAHDPEVLGEIRDGTRTLVMTIFDPTRRHAHSQRILDIPDSHMISGGQFLRGKAQWGADNVRQPPDDAEDAAALLAMIENAIPDALRPKAAVLQE